MMQGGKEHHKESFTSDRKLLGIPVENSQQTGAVEDDEASGNAAECSDSDSEAESSRDVHGDDDLEEGLSSSVYS